jgi:hypothetical protein
VLSRERQEDRRITLKLRLPVAQAESLVIKVKSLGYVFAEEVKRTDVGESISSIESQIRLKEEAIARYRELFKNARTSNEILEMVLCKEFLNASWWYFVGPPPAFGGRRPRAEAAVSPQGWPPPKTSLFIQKVFDCKWY